MGAHSHVDWEEYSWEGSEIEERVAAAAEAEAEETSAAVAIVNSAAHVLAQAQEFDDAAFIEVASAKIRVGEAAGEGAAIGHQVHGAIGFTREHILHRYTQRLWSWRDDFGDESRWAAQLGAAFAAKGGAALWPTLTAI